MSGGIPRCPVCAHVVESVRDEAGWWALPCGHALGRWNFEDLRAQLEAARPPWRFDVPEVPEHVTAFKSRTGVVWVRGLIGPRRQQWAIWSDDPHAWQSAEWFDLDRLIALVPLVECPDPRTAS